MPFTDGKIPAGKAGSSYPVVNDPKRNTAEPWRNGGTTSVDKALSNSPNKNPVNPQEVGK